MEDLHLEADMPVTGQVNVHNATEFMGIQLANPRLSSRVKTQVFDTLQLHDGLDEDALSNNSVKTLISRQVATSAAAMVGGPRFGGWMQDSILADNIGIPRPKQPEYQGPNSSNSRRMTRGNGSSRHGSRSYPKRGTK